MPVSPVARAAPPRAPRAAFAERAGGCSQARADRRPARVRTEWTGPPRQLAAPPAHRPAARRRAAASAPRVSYSLVDIGTAGSAAADRRPPAGNNAARRPASAGLTCGNLDSQNRSTCAGRSSSSATSLVVQKAAGDLPLSPERPNSLSSARYFAHLSTGATSTVDDRTRSRCAHGCLVTGRPARC